MWNYKALFRLDFRQITILFALMWVSLLVISSTTRQVGEFGEDPFFTSYTKNQLQWFGMGWIAYLLAAMFDYRRLREWSWILYVGMVILLVGLFFTSPIQNVHRWYRIPGLGREIQPSEYAKLIVVIALSWFLEKKGREMRAFSAALFAALIVFIPFVLILKQPDLGTALVLFPLALVMFYFGGVSKKLVAGMATLGALGLFCVSLFFTGLLPHEEMRPVMTKVLKDYQYERLNPNTYHQRASQTAIALGSWGGSGWRKSAFTGRKWLPAAHTDSVFAAYAEEFGILGVGGLLALFFALIYYSFQVSLVAKDPFGRLLSAGITVYLAMHVVVNMGMMCGFLPVTGVPLILITYGGSSVLSTMLALGILQSIYSRRFTF